MDCFAGQFAKYEGLTCNATEWMNAYGAKMVDSSGKPTADSPEAAKGLQVLADHYKNGDIPKQAITYQEEQSRAPSRAASCCSCATGRTSTTWPAPTPRRRSRASSPSRRCPA